MSEVRVGQQVTEVRILLTQVEAETWRLFLEQKTGDPEHWPQGFKGFYSGISQVAAGKHIGNGTGNTRPMSL